LHALRAFLLVVFLLGCPWQQKASRSEISTMRSFFARRGAGLSHRAKAARRGIGAVVFGGLALIALQAPARADIIWNFSYNATLDIPYNPLYASNPDGALTASGQLITTALGANKYSITDITGTYNGLAMSLIAAGLYAGNDNLLYPAGFAGGAYFLDGLGFSFMAGGQPVNFYAGFHGLYDTATEDASYEISDNGAFTISPAQIAVPEPSSIALFGAALAALAGFGLMRRRKAASSRSA
jgi:hypothetical protein